MLWFAGVYSSTDGSNNQLAHYVRDIIAFCEMECKPFATGMNADYMQTTPVFRCWPLTVDKR